MCDQNELTTSGIRYSNLNRPLNHPLNLYLSKILSFDLKPWKTLEAGKSKLGIGSVIIADDHIECSKSTNFNGIQDGA